MCNSTDCGVAEQLSVLPFIKGIPQSKINFARTLSIASCNAGRHGNPTQVHLLQSLAMQIMP